MMKSRSKVRIIIVAIAMIISVFALTGCDSGSSLVEIGIGQRHSTQWFDFTIHSAEVVDEFYGFTALHGYQLWVVRITQTGNFHETVPMFFDDWYMDDDSFDGVYVILPVIDGHPEMMPDEFSLTRGQSETHIMVYEIPMDTTNLTLNFLEIDEEDAVGTRFTLNLQ